MRIQRLLAFGLAALLTFLVIQPVVAKGVSRVSVSGPCLDGEVIITDYFESKNDFIFRLLDNSQLKSQELPESSDHFLVVQEIGDGDRVFQTISYFYYPGDGTQPSQIFIDYLDSSLQEHTHSALALREIDAEAELQFRNFLTEQGVAFSPDGPTPFECAEDSSSWLAMLWLRFLDWVN